MNKKVVFKKRIPEPKEMGREEMRVFEKMSSDNYQRWMIPFVDDALSKLKENMAKILDVGCGPGFLVKEIASRGKCFDVYGADLSSHAIRMAKNNCKDLNNAHFKKASVYKLPFPDNAFDMVVCKDSLHHFDDLQKALGEMLRVTKDGGVIYIQDLKRDLPQYLLKRAIPPDTTFKKLQFYSARASYTKEEIKSILKKLKVGSFFIKTRNLAKQLLRKYSDINPKQLREGFQCRYILTIRKQGKS